MHVLKHEKIHGGSSSPGKDFCERGQPILSAICPILLLTLVVRRHCDGVQQWACRRGRRGSERLSRAWVQVDDKEIVGSA